MFILNEMESGELKSTLEKVFATMYKEEKKDPLQPVRQALSRMIRAAGKAKFMDENLLQLGYPINPYSEILGDIEDAIYFLIGEQVDPFENSVTSIAINAEGLSEASRIGILLREYEKNNMKKEPALV